MGGVVGGFNPHFPEKGRRTRVTATTTNLSGIATVTTDVARVRTAEARYTPRGVATVESSTAVVTVVRVSDATVDCQFLTTISGGSTFGISGLAGLQVNGTSGYYYSGGVLEVYAWGD